MASDDGTIAAGPLRIPRTELEWRATRSGGPGGQHVNTSSTRIELVWDIANSPSLDDTARHRLLRRLGTRSDPRGRLRIVSQGERSQLRNRAAALDRLVELVARAMAIPKARRPTRPTAASRRQRRDSKERRSALKRQRRRGDDE